MVKLKEKVTVYNFEVADFHTYFVSDLGIWVHNTNLNNCHVNTSTAKPLENGQFAKNTELPRNATIVRGGSAQPKHLIENQELDQKNNTLSANGGLGVSNAALSPNLKNKQISVVTVGQLNDAGYKVVATPTVGANPNPYHVSIYTPGGRQLTETEAANLSKQFTQVPNPNLNK
ncbi:hypothetical protein ASF12_24540 [Paenibacillus sp. Leaf72]|nr:hypothetical protein ASF12_24540 [Paenibacillus sp. Leaf72]